MDKMLLQRVVFAAACLASGFNKNVGRFGRAESSGGGGWQPRVGFGRGDNIPGRTKELATKRAAINDHFPK